MLLKRILVVEDEQIVAADLRQSLSEAGYGVPAVVSTGEDAVRQAAAGVADLVLMDIHLKGAMDGVEAAERISRMNLPVVFLTAYTDDGTVARAGKTDAYGYLVKPYNPRELKTTIEIALASHSRRKRETLQADLIALLDSLTDAVVAVERNSRVVFLNKAAEALTRWPRKEAMGADASAVVALSGESREANLPVVCVLTQKDGNRMLVECSSAILRDRTGRTAGTVFVIREAASRRRHEMEQRRVQQLEAIRKLAGSMAHDYGNLLTVIAGYTEMLISSLDAASPQSHPAHEIRRATERASTLTRKLLAVSRHREGAFTAVDLNAVVSAVQPLLCDSLGRSVRVRAALADKLPLISADSIQLQEALFSLAAYYREVLPAGDLSVQTSRIDVDERDAAGHSELVPGTFVLLTFLDNGPGPPADAQSRIFEPYTIASPGSGAGISLAELFATVTQLHGHVWMHNEPGRGNRLEILFPALSELPQPARFVPERGRAEGGAVVLVVDDEPALRHLAREILEGAGYQVLEAEDGEQAIDVCTSYDGPIDLLLTDILMPGLSGPALAARISTLRPGTGIAYISGYGHLTASLEPETAVLIDKPFTPEGLRQKVAEALAARAVGE